MQNLKNKNQFW